MRSPLYRCLRILAVSAECLCLVVIAGMGSLLLGFALIGYVENNGAMPLTSAARWGYSLIGFALGFATGVFGIKVTGFLTGLLCKQPTEGLRPRITASPQIADQLEEPSQDCSAGISSEMLRFRGSTAATVNSREPFSVHPI